MKQKGFTPLEAKRPKTAEAVPMAGRPQTGFTPFKVRAQGAAAIKDGLLQTGFTLIELLVVISIVGMLASIILVAVTKTRSKSRDAKRIADIHQFQTALEMYYSKNSYYPPAGATLTTSIFNWSDMFQGLEQDGEIAQTPAAPSSHPGLAWLTQIFLIAKAVAATGLFPFSIKYQDPSYPNDYYSYMPNSSSAPSGYRIRAQLENLNNSALQSGLSGNFLHDSNTTGASSCDATLGYYCVGSGGSFSTGSYGNQFTQ